MKVKLDELMSKDSAGFLRGLGHDVLTVREEGLEGEDDRVVLSAATAERRLLITMDLDFSDIRNFPPGDHAGVVLLRGVQRPPEQVSGLKLLMVDYRLDDLEACHVVVQGNAIRVHKPDV